MSSSRDFKVTALLLVLALLVGGAGLSFPILQMVLQLAACVLAGYLLLSGKRPDLDRLTRFAVAVLAAILLLPLAQLIPLPESAWQALPGRETAIQLDSILGWSLWRPLTLDVGATIAAFLTLLPAAAVFIAASHLRLEERVRLLWIIFGFALFGAILGIAQFVTGGNLTPYPSSHLGYAVGLFVNRNHNAALLLVAIPLAGALGALEAARGTRRLLAVVLPLCAMVLLSIAVLGTTSRMGLALLPIALGSALLLLFYRQPPWRIVFPSILGFTGLILLLFIGGGFDRTLVRFSSLTDPRLSYWTDVRWALGHYGLAGTGLGTFERVYESAESLEAVVPAITIHAHNDFLELLLEGGIPAVAILALFFAAIGTAVFRCAKSQRPETAPLTVAAAVGVLLLLAFSLVDYPLRMPALASVFAVLVVVLLRGATPRPGPGKQLIIQDSRRGAARLRKVQIGAGLVALALLGFIVVDQGISARDFQRRDFDSAIEMASWNTRARESRATDLLLSGDLRAARNEALAAVKLSPIDGPAIRTIGAVRLAENDRSAGRRLMNLALALGWRDPLTQLWGLEAATASREPEKAVQRAEALFRQDRATTAALSELLVAPSEAKILPVLVSELAQGPQWRDAFFASARSLRGQDAERFATILDSLRDSHSPPTSNEIQPLLSSLTAAGEVQQAQKIWQAVHRDHLVANGNFEELAADEFVPAPAQWSIRHAYQSQVEVKESKGARGRFLSLSAIGSTTVLSQQLMLPPGQYALSYKARTSGPAAIRWELRCVGSHAGSVAATSIGPDTKWQSITAILTVPDQNCPIQTLALKGAGSTTVRQLELDDVELISPSR